MPHTDLLSVVLLSTMFSSVKTFYIYRRHWCGYKLWPSVLFTSLLPITCIIIVYFKILEMLNWSQLERYDFPIYLTAAVLAEVLSRFLLRKEAPHLEESVGKKLPVLPVIRRITKKKLSVAEELSKKPDCRELLDEVIEASDLARVRKNALRKKLSRPPTKIEILMVINEVGLTYVKLLIS